MRTKPLSSSIDWHPPPYYCGYFGTARVLELMFGESNRNFVTLLTASAGSTTVGHELTVPARSVRTTRRQIPAAGVTWERNYGAFCKEIAARPILYPGRQWRSTSNSETADITFSVAGFPSIPSFMPSCGASRQTASSIRFQPLAWSRSSEPLHFTWRIARQSTPTCKTEGSSSRGCERSPGVSILRFILSWRPSGTGRQLPAHEAAILGRRRLQPEDRSRPAPP